MTRIAGSRPSRRCGRAARRSRIALHSVPSMAVCQAASSSSSNRPGGGPPELTTSRSRPPNACDRRRDGRRPGRPASTGRPGRRAREPRRPRRRADRSAGRSARPGLPRRAASAAIAPPSPPLPPPTSARAPASPRSIATVLTRPAPRDGDARRSRSTATPRLGRLPAPTTISIERSRRPASMTRGRAGTRPAGQVSHGLAHRRRREADDREVVGPRRRSDDGMRSATRTPSGVRAARGRRLDRRTRAGC